MTTLWCLLIIVYRAACGDLNVTNYHSQFDLKRENTNAIEIGTTQVPTKLDPTHPITVTLWANKHELPRDLCEASTSTQCEAWVYLDLSDLAKQHVGSHVTTDEPIAEVVDAARKSPERLSRGQAQRTQVPHMPAKVVAYAEEELIGPEEAKPNKQEFADNHRQQLLREKAEELEQRSSQIQQLQQQMLAALGLQHGLDNAKQLKEIHDKGSSVAASADPVEPIMTETDLLKEQLQELQYRTQTDIDALRTQLDVKNVDDGAISALISGLQQQYSDTYQKMTPVVEAVQEQGLKNLRELQLQHQREMDLSERKMLAVKANLKEELRKERAEYSPLKQYFSSLEEGFLTLDVFPDAMFARYTLIRAFKQGPSYVEGTIPAVEACTTAHQSQKTRDDYDVFSACMIENATNITGFITEFAEECEKLVDYPIIASYLHQIFERKAWQNTMDGTPLIGALPHIVQAMMLNDCEGLTDETHILLCLVCRWMRLSAERFRGFIQTGISAAEELEQPYVVRELERRGYPLTSLTNLTSWRNKCKTFMTNRE